MINRDRMWHYVEGIANWNPVWPLHGIRILPGPSSLWLDATGQRLPAPLYPGFDTLGTLEYLRRTGHDHSWFILTKKIIAREFALSGSEQNPDLTGRDRRAMLTSRFGGAVPGPVQAFLDHGEDFVTAATLPDLVSRMNELTGGSPPLSAEAIGSRSGRATRTPPARSARTSRRTPSGGRAPTSATGSSASPGRTRCSTRRRGR